MKTKALYLVFAFLFILQPLLRADDNPYQEIKFTWVRTFDAPIIITVWNYPRDGIFLIKTEIYSGKGGYDWGEAKNSMTKLTEEEASALVQQFSAIDFPGIYKNYPKGGVDGSTWTFEAHRSGSGFEYGFWSPKNKKEAADMVAFARHLLELADIEVPEREFY